MANRPDPLAGTNLAFVEQLYARYLADPDSVDASWHEYFDEVAGSDGDERAARAAVDGPSFERASLFSPPADIAADRDFEGAGRRSLREKQSQVDQLIHAYRVRGHLKADLDPLGRARPSMAELELDHWGLTQADLSARFSSSMIAGTTEMTLQEILDLLHEAYCGRIGVQFMHIDDLEAKSWLKERMENRARRASLSREQQLRILTKLTDAENLEQFIHRKFPGAKRFSLEGAESLIPLLDLALEKAAEQEVREVVIGMAHRGRLNVLVNVMGKSPRVVFREFRDDNPDAFRGSGDVKYHLGHSCDRTGPGDHEMHLSLCFNPSHLEFVNPVLMGRVRAKQDRFGDFGHERCLGIAIHGDAAFAGQGVTQELLNMAELRGYRTGGTLHIVVNNQIGFTTPPEEGRSTRYSADVARMLQTPIFHVNGEDPEAVAQVVGIALDYREKFGTDVIVDMYCYRRYGHNESDEPAFTQPKMYSVIRSRKTVREAYLERLERLGEVTKDEAEEIQKNRKKGLDDELAQAKEEKNAPTPSSGAGIWESYPGGRDAQVDEVATAFEAKALRDAMDAICRTPAEFRLHPKLKRLFDVRSAMGRGEQSLDWGAAESLAFATLLEEGYPVRFSGQDSGRGTFSHRHAILYDEENGEPYVPLQHLADARFQIYNSPLSEVAVLGFEYGYSLDTPEGLTIWEAQFGDFCNVAQVIIDQFITSSEDKWNRLSGLVMLLPHGFEGQGPEHSSARLERFLNLCAEDNIQVVNLTTPAQIFHCLRRQVLRPWRKPLVVMAPKSLLRHPRAVSQLSELSEGSFQRIIPDVSGLDSKNVERILLASGKVYYELEERRESEGRGDVAIVRLEQYYPLHPDELRSVLGVYSEDVPVLWVQEEPRNMGAWSFLKLHFTRQGRLLGTWRVRCVSRRESASPATGSSSAHKQEQKELIDRAFGPLTD
ncbi:MAG: 2-oxoglutarate dehydrogenase E1 component [Thermoanaerobaculia bacterium]|nr:2-oxoglutarate dehydrogenase E1 component [Thermoanaerobaculia bacterium]